MARDLGGRKPGGRVSRRAFLQTAALGGAAALALGFQAPAPGGRGGAASGGGGPAGPSAAAGASGGPAGWEGQWNALVEAAKAEGLLLMSGPPTPEMRTDVPA